MRYHHQRNIPKGSLKLTRPDAPTAVIYAYERDGKLFAVAYQGKRNKADWHFRFRNQARREEAIKEFFDRVRAIQAYKQERQQTKHQTIATGKGFELGDILEYSWGYDQTNYDFFQVIARTKRMVTIQEVGQHRQEAGFMSSDVMPKKDALLDKPVEIKLEQFLDDGRPYLSMDHGLATKYNGGTRHATYYA